MRELRGIIAIKQSIEEFRVFTHGPITRLINSMKSNLVIRVIDSQYSAKLGFGVHSMKRKPRLLV